MSKITAWIARLRINLLLLKFVPWPEVKPDEWPLYCILSDAVPFGLVQRVTDFALYHYDRRRANVWLEHAKVASDKGRIHQSNAMCMAYMAVHPDYNPKRARGDSLKQWNAFFGNGGPHET